MESGEKEMRMAFEEVTTRNVKTMIAYSTETRQIVRDMQEKVDLVQAQLRQADEKINNLTRQLSVVQAKLYSGGT